MPIAAKSENALTLMSAMMMAVIAKKRVSAAKNRRLAIAVSIAPRSRSLNLGHGRILQQSFVHVKVVQRDVTCHLIIDKSRKVPMLCAARSCAVDGASEPQSTQSVFFR